MLLHSPLFNYYQWHEFTPWWPCRIDNYIAWMEPIERRLTDDNPITGALWEYRLWGQGMLDEAALIKQSNDFAPPLSYVNESKTYDVFMKFCDLARAAIKKGDVKAYKTYIKLAKANQITRIEL